MGRNIVLFAAANSVLALLLPWLVIGGLRVNAFGLLSYKESLDGLGAGWVFPMIWIVLAASLIAAGLALADRWRPLGFFCAVAALQTGALLTFLCVMIFRSVLVLRQVGVVAMGTAGLVFIAGGALLIRAPWRPARPGAEGFIARARRLPWVTVALVAANVLAYFVLAFRGDYQTRIVRELGLIGGSLRWYAFLTSMFLHAGWLHLAANMAVLVAVGAVLERRVGRAVFVAVYFAAGAAGAVASILIDPRTYVPLVGSSGAVAGVVGLCLAAAPRAKVKLWYHAGVAAGWVEVRAAWLFSAWIALQAVGAFYLSIGAADAIAYWGHLGGAALGLLAGGVLRRLGRAGSEEPEVGRTQAASASAGFRRARRRERAALAYLPHGLVAVSLAVSVLAASLTFTGASLLGTLASFQRAWNTGDLERVARFFPAERKEYFRGGLRRIAARLDPGAPEGRTSYTIALMRARKREGECKALYASAPPGADPFRDEGCGTISVVLLRERGRWVVHAVGLGDIRPGGSD